MSVTLPICVASTAVCCLLFVNGFKSTQKKDVLSRETYSRNSINYSEGMADDQKDRYIQYLAEQNYDLRLTSDAMTLVLEDFMAQMKELNSRWHPCNRNNLIWQIG